MAKRSARLSGGLVPTLALVVDQADEVATSLVACAETRAAFARKRREAELAEDELRRIVSDVINDWERFFAIEVTRAVALSAGDLAEKYGLRGFDAIHLASAVTLAETVASPVTFSAADRHLQAAAQAEGLEVTF